ncbi:retropepsin-like aspartic protease [Lutibacter sp. B1]|uniref:retropepsin-like aspartic protease n=1 Tax=Lutibacter sp. B1 TaxID=2725996 RepID=UPI0014569167|nr:retropepsin-like aspartic protease [Lutibacter sp. B1]NLP59315.1 TIGR02281 family clan AA aspartic protease [Lutibacter sp. B1]
MRKIILFLLIIFTTNEVLAQTTINLDRTNGVYTVPCKVNGIPMNFIFDTGASNVTISLTEATFLIKQGLLGENDIKESVKYQIANGDVNEGTNIILREIEIAGLKIQNVKATIVHEQNAPLLLGMSALSQLGKIEIENNKLIINDFSFKKNKENVDFDKEIKETIDWINSIFVKYQFETLDSNNDAIKHKANIKEIIRIKEIDYIHCFLSQETSRSYASFKAQYLIPVNKINSIHFNNRTSNYNLAIRIKNNEKSIITQFDYKDGVTLNDVTDECGFVLDKSIDEKNLKPKLKNAFEYIIDLYKSKPMINNTSLNSKENKEITIKYKNGVEVFNINLGNEQHNYKEDKEYFWYTEFSKIKSTKGGSGGNLLNGNYKFYDENGNLLIDENYSMGLKDGDRKKWDEKGELTEINKYEDGVSVYWKYHPDGDDGWVEQIGEMLNDGWIKNSYTKYGRLVAKQETFFDELDKIKKLKTKTTLYFSNSENQIKEVFITPMMFNNSLIGKYQKYYENGQIEVSGEFFDSFKNGIKNYFGNIRIGDWKWYKENGDLDGQGKYKAELEYWDNGNIKFVYGMIYDNNEWIKHGFQYSFNEDGKGIAGKSEYTWGELKKTDD